MESFSVLKCQSTVTLPQLQNTNWVPTMVRLDEPRVLWDLCGLRVVVRHVLGGDTRQSELKL